MARPVVLVYQEYASVTVTPTTPDLNCLLVGPAYWIKDYLDDKGDLLVSSGYGTKNSNNPYTPPVAFTDAITVAEPPGNKTGALLDSESVTVYFDECRVLIAEDADTGDASTGASVTATSLASGLLLAAMDLAAGRMRLDELAGAVVLAKLAAVAWLALAASGPDATLAAFWGLLVASSLIAHAPKPVRHWRPGRPGKRASKAGRPG